MLHLPTNFSLSSASWLSLSPRSPTDKNCQLRTSDSCAHVSAGGVSKNDRFCKIKYDEEEEEVKKKKKERSVKLLLQINVVYLQENACKEHQNMLHTNAHVSENDMLAYNPESRVSPFVTRTITKQRFQGGNHQVTDLRLTLNSSKVH